MKNFVQAGTVVTVTAPRDVDSGELIAVGALVGFTQTAAAGGADVAMVTDGVYHVAVTASGALSAGDIVYLDGQDLTDDDDGSANPRAGIVINGGDEDDGIAFCDVKINA